MTILTHPLHCLISLSGFSPPLFSMISVQFQTIIICHRPVDHHRLSLVDELGIAKGDRLKQEGILKSVRMRWLNICTTSIPHGHLAHNNPKLINSQFNLMYLQPSTNVYSILSRHWSVHQILHCNGNSTQERTYTAVGPSSMVLFPSFHTISRYSPSEAMERSNSWQELR